MKKVILVALTMFIAMPGFARDSANMFSIKEALAANGAKERLGDQVKFYFGDQSHPAVARKISQDWTNQKTNAFGKSDLEACQWVFLSAMLALRDAALNRGADAVINIESYYDKQPVSDSEQFECHAGNVIAGVALRGDFVKLK